MARIAIAGFMHETNCSCRTRRLREFCQPAGPSRHLRGERILEEFAERGASTAGFLNGSDGNHEIAPLLWTSTHAGRLRH